MKRIPSLNAFVAIAAGFCAAWALAAPPKEPTPKTVAVAEQDSGKKIELRVGDKLAVRLKANHTTGFTWEGGTPTGAALKLLTIRYVSDEAPKSPRGEPAGGVGGTYMADYVAAKAGKATVTLDYRQPWESRKPEKTVTYTVTVTKPKPSPKKPK